MAAKEGTTEHTSSVPLIFLASNSRRGAEHLHRTLQQEGFRVQLAPEYPDLQYRDLEPILEQRDGVVLIEISNPQLVEAAVDMAMSLKRRDSSQFVGYIVDPILHTSGLAGDALFPRSTHHLPRALRDFFRNEPASS